MGRGASAISCSLVHNSADGERPIAARTIDLREQEAAAFPASALSVEEAVAIAGDKLGRVSVEWPTVANGHLWILRSAGWVGSLPVTRDLTLRVAPKIAAARLFELLDHVNGTDVFRTFAGHIMTADIEGVRETLARMLVRGIAGRIGSGLHRAYREELYRGQAPRDRVLHASTLRRFATGRPEFICSIAPISADIADNRILAWTLHVLAALPLGDPQVLAEAVAISRALASFVVLQPCDGRDCRRRDYGRANADYRHLHSLCALLLDAVGPYQGPGEAEFVPFGIWMPELFERAVVEALRSVVPPGVAVVPSEVVHLGGGSRLRFEIDAVLYDRRGEPMAVVDAKYKDGRSPDESDIQQVVAYATSKRVSAAVLVYAAAPTLSRPLDIGGVKLNLVHLDIGKSFAVARDELRLAMSAIAPPDDRPRST